MTAIIEALHDLSLGSPSHHDGLTIHPLTRSRPHAKDYLTLDEALSRKSAQISEISAGGSVPQLLIRNLGAEAVFLLDGEELVGAKQNRVLNISILAPAKVDTVILVSCVEAGRWRPVSPDFSTAPRAQFAASRAKKAAHVSNDLCSTGERRSDQGEVWADITSMLSALGSHSDTRAVEAAYTDHESRLRCHVDRFAPQPRQVGGVFSIAERVVGLDLFDSDATCTALLPKVVRSYALDAIDPAYAGPQQPRHCTPEGLLEELREVKVHEAPAVGEGTDLRLDNASGLAGGALFARGRVVHLVAFVMGDRAWPQGSRVHRRW